MEMSSGWEWASGFPQVPVGALTGACHLCRPFWEEAAARTMRGLGVRFDRATITSLNEKYRGLSYINLISRNEIYYLYAQLDRIKRISGLYAGAFKALSRQALRFLLLVLLLLPRMW